VGAEGGESAWEMNCLGEGIFVLAVFGWVGEGWEFRN